MTNHLHYGDNLTVLRDSIADASVDLVYLDPPFNSNASYNVLFKAPDGASSAAQIEAFDDTWHWNDSASLAYDAVMRSGNGAASEMLRAMRGFLGENDMMAYLAMMAARLIELHRVLKPTGSLYLHCDPTASHYLKILLDAVFGTVNFRNEIIWQRMTGKSLMKRRLPTNHDVLLVYQKTDAATWNDSAIYVPYDLDNLPEKTRAKYSHRDPDGRVYRLDNLINPNSNRPNLTYEFLGVTKVWRWTRERMQAAYDAGIVVQSGPGKVPQQKRYIDEQEGIALSDVWTDIPPLNSQAQERLGYPTQKPVALLERILSASSNQWWAVSLVDAVPFGGKKKGADGGIDGHIFFRSGAKTTEKAIVSVKGGGVGVKDIRELIAVVDRKRAKIGVYVSLEPHTEPMIKEATGAGLYDGPTGKVPKIQLFTIEELFGGKKTQIPLMERGFKAAAREERDDQSELDL